MGSAQILIVEDEQITAICLQKELEGMGYSVPGVAATGAEALRQAAETSPDLVLMDVVLQGELDGIETSRRMRQRRRVPVVYLSAYEDDRTLARARETEPYGYLIKPCEERELHATIEMALYKHRIEQCLRETEGWLTAILRSVTDAVIATDVMKRVGFMNPVAEQITGQAAEQVLEHDLSRVVHFQGDGAEDLFEQVEARAIESGETVHLPRPTRLLARDGRHIPIEGTVSPIRDEEGVLSGYVWVFRDVSERLRIEERLHQSADLLRRTQRREAVSKLAGDIAHDFNNLLTVILGNTSLVLCHLPESDRNLRPLLQIESAALGAMDLVKRLQGYSRLTDPRQGPANLNVSAQRVWEDLRRLIDLPVAIDFQLAAELWPVQADPTAVETILTSLCINVCHAMPHGGRLVIETENVVLSSDEVHGQGSRHTGEYVRLRVCDPSNGIAPLFQYRGPEPRADEAQATLPAIQEVFESAEQCGGWIECLSDARRGACLDIFLPRARTEPAVRQAADAPAVPRKHPPTILLVDDEPMLRDLGRNILTRNGYHVLLAEDGAEAVEIYRDEQQHIDLVILDLTMPSLSGDDTFLQLLRINPDVRVLFCSGYPADHVKSLGHERMVGFLHKPYRNEELVNAVHSALV